MVADGILVPTRTSAWASPIVVVGKSDGSVRICLDGKASINRFLTVEHYPLPKIDDILAKISNWKIFCKIDLTGAYLQVKLAENSQEICTINTHKGLYKYTRMPFGLSTAPAIFQTIIDQILLKTQGIAYMDDILVGGENEKQCKENLCEVLSRLEEHSVRVNGKKSVFFETEIEYLGYKISKNGITPNESKVEALVKAPVPMDVMQLQAYLGMVNYYSRFLPNLATVLSPLYELLRKDKKYVWSKECQEAFEKTKTMLVAKHMLEPFDPKKPVVLAVDASPYGLGAILSHEIGGVEKPVYFASVTLTQAQKNYAQVHKEALAVVFGVQKFHKYIYGIRFKLVTDNSGVKEIFKPTRTTSSIAVARLSRWALILANYEYTIEHRPGKYMSNVDALSRLPLSEELELKEQELQLNAITSSSIIDIGMIRKAQEQDPIIQQVYKNVENGWSKGVKEALKSYAKISNSFGIEQGVLYFNDRVVVPDTLKEKMIALFHDDHNGIVRMKMSARKLVWWKGMDRDFERSIQECQVCQSRRVVPKEIVKTSWAQSIRPFQRVHIDFCHFENRTLLVIVDSFSKFIEVKVMRSTKAEDVIEVLEMFFSCFGLAETIVSDNGPPFNSGKFVAFLKSLGIEVKKTPPYHPQSNGVAERAVRTVKDSLKKYLLDERLKAAGIQRKISRFLLNYRNSPCTVTKVAPAEKVFCYAPHTLLAKVNPKVHQEGFPKEETVVRNTVPQNTVPETSREEGYQYEEEEGVYYRNHFKETVRWIPAVVKKKISRLRYLISVNGLVRMVHQNQIRKKHSAREIQAWICPRRSGQLKRTEKRKRSEASPPPLRRSKRLEGQPRFKYPR
ncbi:uncharacterized protein K02A2.6-like [Anopheles aquasalis]|uniref:uncharacterized protein K02A2.6-like n=1 Tax=Anopheles aquasalis TaxID=42839 RepID=UPI00215ACC28|nr:uncharacterized protein K02A2.6-like [Anopheles aquasalis]